MKGLIDMKKLIIMILFVLSIFSTVLVQAEDNIIGNIYSTDILAYVNGNAVESYNIGGKTVVIAEDLADNYYGFNYVYDDEKRLLEVNSNFTKPQTNSKKIERGTLGKIEGNVYATDIKVKYNGIEINGYNIGGKTAICLEELGELYDSPNKEYGYSKYLGKTIWNEKERSIYFESYLDNFNEIKISRVNYGFCDNILYVYSDDLSKLGEITTWTGKENFQNTYNYSKDFDKYSINKLYIDINGEKYEIGTSVAINTNGADVTHFSITNIQKAEELIKKVKTPQMSYNEAISYFNNNYKVVDNIENEEYAVLLVKEPIKDVTYFVVSVKKSGGFVVLEQWRHSNIQIKIEFEKDNILNEIIYPWAGPHGTTTAIMSSDLDYWDYD